MTSKFTILLIIGLLETCLSVLLLALLIKGYTDFVDLFIILFHTSLYELTKVLSLHQLKLAELFTYIGSFSYFAI